MDLLLYWRFRDCRTSHTGRGATILAAKIDLPYVRNPPRLSLATRNKLVAKRRLGFGSSVQAPCYSARSDRMHSLRMSLSAGDRLGPYEILAPVGAGGMGEVYKGRDTRLDRIIAIKILKPGARERFEREARAISALNHPHICDLHDIGTDGRYGFSGNGVP